jgi:putative transposase
VTFQFIRDHREHFPVRLMCRVLEASPSGFYDWLRRPESQRAAEDRALIEKIQATRADGQPAGARQPGSRCGGATAAAQGKAAGYRIGRKREQRIRCSAHARKRHPAQDQAQVQGHHRQPSRSSNRAQPAGSAVHGRGAEHGLAGRSELHREGWLYLAVVLDLFSRQVVGWAMDEQMPQELTPGHGAPAALPGLMHHSDRGSQYAAGAYQKRLVEHAIVCSMSRKGNCWEPVRVSEANMRRWRAFSIP